MTDAIRDMLLALKSESAIAFEIDEPNDPQGEWWIDLVVDGMATSISWRSAVGFGIFTGEPGIGDRPNEIFLDPGKASARLLQLAAIWRREARKPALGLRDLRHLVGETQVQIAQALGTDQAGVSRLEKRGDMKISTLMSYLNAMGGKLEMRVLFPSFEADISPLSPVEPARNGNRHAA